MAASISASDSGSNVFSVSPVAGVGGAIGMGFSRGPIRPTEGVPMKHAKHTRFTFAFALLLALAPFAAFAQSSTGSISGTATDDSRAAIPGVTVTAANTANGATRSTVTNSAGHYELALL